MVFELLLVQGFQIIILAFIAEFIDSTLGMGYGTALTPILIMMGFEPLQIVPMVLFSELFTGTFAGLVHHRVGNINLKLKSKNPVFVAKKLEELGFIEAFKRGVPLHLKVTLLLAFCGVFGSLISILIAISLPVFYLKLYIGLLILVIGFFILLTLKKSFKFSWLKIAGLGLIASFNKGISGGGYGPVVTGGQVLSGVDSKNAVGITSLSEAMTCFVGIIIYMITTQKLDWTIAPYLITGALLAVPFSALTVKKVNRKIMKLFIGVFTVGLGLFTLIKLI